jgi:hypothetical protein
VRIEVDTAFDIGDRVRVREEQGWRWATVAAVMVEVGGELNVFYRLHAEGPALECNPVIEEHLLQGNPPGNSFRPRDDRDTLPG